MISKPLLAPNKDPLSFPDFFKKLPYPLLMSPKFDGIRAIAFGEEDLRTRTMKQIPSAQARVTFGRPGLMGMDGELIEGNPTDADVYNRTQSHVMSHDKEGNLGFYAFDDCSPSTKHLPFYQRFEHLTNRVKYINEQGIANIHLVPHDEVNSYDELVSYENKALELGFEGVMGRTPWGAYKEGRATFLDQIIYKLKRFQDAEAQTIGFQEQMINNNVQERDERGYAKRSQSLAGLVGAGTLGAFICLYNGIEITVAPGNFSHKERQHIWDHREQFIGMLLKFRFFSYGVKDLPRFPRAVGFRSPLDL